MPTVGDYGIQVNRSGSKAQIDGKYRNYWIFKNAALNTSSGAGLIYLWVGDSGNRPLTSDHPPFVALSLEGTDSSHFATSLHYAHFDSVTYNAWTSITVYTDNLNSINYMVLCPPVDNWYFEDTYGMKIFNEDGKECFRSWVNYPELIGSYSWSGLTAPASPIWPPFDTTDVTVEDADNYFVIVPNHNWWWGNYDAVTGANNIWYYTMRMHKHDSTTVRIDCGFHKGSYNTGAGMADFVNDNLFENSGTLLEFAPVKALE